jgi:predicted  nucleic acid-binding Zn-ribbon protein
LNNERRNQLSKIQRELEAINNEISAKAAEEETGEAGDAQTLADLEENWSSRVDDIRQDLDGLKDDEQEYYGNMPEGLQGGERGSMAEDAISNMDSALSDLEELVNVEEKGGFVKLWHEKFDDLIGYVESAQD